MKHVTPTASVIIKKHCVESLPKSGLSPLQENLLNSQAKIRICSAPTGAGKSYAFQRAILREERVLFVVPTRRLAQNLKLSMVSSLLDDHGWSQYEVDQKIAIWSSDETLRLKESGEKNVMAKRLSGVSYLNQAIDKGEMIIAVPEVISYLLLRDRPNALQSDIGIFDFLEAFDHIVFDEFHTIAARGFGLAALFAKLVTEIAGSPAKVSFLSATPVDLSPVLMSLAIPENMIVHYKEKLTQNGRAVHGDVTLSLWEFPDMPSLMDANLDLIKDEVDHDRQVVVIYNNLGELQRHLDLLEALLREIGIKAGEALLINSIDDSRIACPVNDNHVLKQSDAFFSVGREENPKDYKILIATASVEMGVTFKSNLLFMEPGFEAANFLQRYGRAARGNHDGQVLVRIDDYLLKKNRWLKKLKKWIISHNGEHLTIDEDLTPVLTQSYQKRFKSSVNEESVNHFGKLPSRAAYTAGLYWNLLMRHFSTQGGRWKLLQNHQPPPSKVIYHLLQTVRQMEQNSTIGFIVKSWCDRFEQEAKTLRDIGRGIRIRQKGNETVFIQEPWLRRNTDLLDRLPLLIDDQGEEMIEIHQGTFQDYMLSKDECPYVKAMRTLSFPHTEYSQVFEDNFEIVKSWCRAFEDRSNDRVMAWELYPNEMKAVKKLVQLTGLLVNDEESDSTGMGVQSTIL